MNCSLAMLFLFYLCHALFLLVLRFAPLWSLWRPSAASVSLSDILWHCFVTFHVSAAPCHLYFFYALVSSYLKGCLSDMTDGLSYDGCHIMTGVNISTDLLLQYEHAAFRAFWREHLHSGKMNTQAYTFSLKLSCRIRSFLPIIWDHQQYTSLYVSFYLGL